MQHDDEAEEREAAMKGGGWGVPEILAILFGWLLIGGFRYLRQRAKKGKRQ